MTREQVIRKAMEGHITWEQAANICRLSPRQLLRVRLKYEQLGYVPKDGRAGRVMPKKLSPALVERVVGAI